ncbi:hypothetical protein EXH44_01905 [Actinobacillus indolicus]|uniref:Lipoprotein n=1 Tax=Actinobacillus indolicus TaxID=51049 RepID=A0A4P7CIN0_9PAST|nr:hypothetical protein [Actinobacillus indolicus]QBQ63071.1 hypothetical protein EXH44_01905 [Actinobacillus indolicus]
MKLNLMKFLPSLAAVTVLAACSSNTSMVQEQSVVEQAQQTATQQANRVAEVGGGKSAVSVEKVTDRTKSVAYRCLNNQQVTASYAFSGDDVRAVNLVLGSGKKATTLPTLMRDSANRDFISFSSDKHVWSVENGFTFDNATTKVGGILTEKGSEVDVILAKLCDINKSATARLNK